MFCPYCGKETLPNASFCIACGKSVVVPEEATTPVTTDPSADQDVRQKELEALNRSIEHFSQKAARFKEYDIVCERLNHYARGAKSALLIFGIIFTALGALVSLICLEDLDYESFQAFFIVVDIPAILMLIGGILMKTLNAKKRSHYAEKYFYLSQELYRHYTLYPHCPVPAEYVNPEILAVLANNLYFNRSANVQEALNNILNNYRYRQLVSYFHDTNENTYSINTQTHVPVLFAPAKFFK